MVENEDILSFYKSMNLCSDFIEDKKVGEEDIRVILEAGRLSPSSFGLEPWKFLVIENNYLKDQIYRLSNGFKKRTNLGSFLVIILSRKPEDLKYNSEYVRYIMRDIQEIPDNYIYRHLDQYKLFLEEDFNILYDDKEFSAWIGKQSYIALTNMMLAAHALGINSCPVEGFNREDLETFLCHEKLLDREKFTVSCMISFGYSKELTRGEKKRRSFTEVIDWIK